MQARLGSHRRCDSGPIDGRIATPHRLATAAGERAMNGGGSAVDGAITAAAVLAVVYPHMSALGGDLFALVREPGGAVTVINASGPAPARIDAPRLRAAGRLPRSGVDAVTVPGMVAGWGALHALAGRRPWADCRRDAELLARDGAEVTARLAAAIEELRPCGSLADVFAPGGAPLATGDLLRQPALADTLEAIRDGGARSLYEGPLAARFADGLRALGSTISADDLAAFTPVVEAPLRTAFGSMELLTAAPNSSGMLLAQALRALDHFGLDDPLGGDAARLATIFVAGMAQRARELGDPRYSVQDPERWLSDAAIEALAEPPAVGARTASPTGDTVAVVAVDADGRAISLNQSIYDSFGAQLLEPSTGIVLHNRGSAFSVARGHPNEIRPGKRPSHTLMPVAVEEKGHLRGVLATMGGPVHAQIHTQVLLRLLAGEHPARAVAAPRFAAFDGRVFAESDLDPALRESLRPDQLLEPHSEFLGHAQAVWRQSIPDGVFEAGTDPRADG